MSETIITQEIAVRAVVASVLPEHSMLVKANSTGKLYEGLYAGVNLEIVDSPSPTDHWIQTVDNPVHAGLTLTDLSGSGSRWVVASATGVLSAPAKPTTLAGYGITDAQGLDADLTALAAISCARGSMIRGSAAGAWEGLALGTNGYLLGANATDVVYNSLAGWGIAPLTHGVSAGYIPYASSTTAWANSPKYTDGTNVGIGTTTLGGKLSILISSAIPNLQLDGYVGQDSLIRLSMGAYNTNSILLRGYNYGRDFEIWTGAVSSETVKFSLNGTTGSAYFSYGLHIGGTSDAGDNNLLVDGTATITGNCTLTTITAGNVPYATTAGLLTESNLTCDGTHAGVGLSTDLSALGSFSWVIEGYFRHRGIGAANIRYRSDWAITSGGLEVNVYDDTGDVYLPMQFTGKKVSFYSKTDHIYMIPDTDKFVYVQEAAKPGLVLYKTNATTKVWSFVIDGTTNELKVCEAGTTDARMTFGNGSGSVAFTYDLTVGTRFGCNGKASQAAYASGGAAAAGGTGATEGAYDTAAHRDGLITLVNNIRASLVACGIMS